jgi:hypothetical protein
MKRFFVLLITLSFVKPGIALSESGAANSVINNVPVVIPPPEHVNEGECLLQRPICETIRQKERNAVAHKYEYKCATKITYRTKRNIAFVTYAGTVARANEVAYQENAQKLSHDCSEEQDEKEDHRQKEWCTKVTEKLISLYQMCSQTKQHR